MTEKELKFKNEIEQTNPLINYVSGYDKDVIVVSCKEMGHVYTSTYDINYKVKKCKSCTGNVLVYFQQAGKENYLNDMLENEPDYEWLEPYKRDNKKKHLIRHKLCMNEYEVRPNDFQQGYRCPECSRKESAASRKLTSFLTENNILFEKETVLMPNLSTVGGQYKIDFKIKDIFFEIDGEQHFRTTSKWAANGRVRIRDNEKNTYCAENNLTLIRIPYHKSTHSPKIIKHIENILKIEGTDSIQNYCSLNGLLYITNKNIYENNYYTINDAIYQNRD
jgi:hypothetical protein